MKFIYSFFLLVTFGLLVNNVSTPKQQYFTKNEMREVNLRLQSIGNL